MPFLPRHRKSRRVTLVLLFSFAIVSVGIALVHARSRPILKERANGRLAIVPNIPQSGPSTPSEVELIDLSMSGFEPLEIARPAGRFLLGVNNRTRLTNLSLLLLNESGTSVVGKQLSKLKTWRQVLDLPPGRYELREANHRDWLCRITITAR